MSFVKNRPSLGILALSSVLLMTQACLPSAPIEYPLQPLTDDTENISPPIADESRTCVDFNPQRNPYFGDTHVHSVYSLDSWLWSNLLSPRMAYQYAKGTTIEQAPFDSEGNPTLSLTIDRPLDFTMVSDHAEHFGEQRTCADPSLAGYDSGDCRRYREARVPNDVLFRWNVQVSAQQDSVERFDFCGANGANCVERAKSTWEREIAAANIEYDVSTDCSFTTFIGYEWTGGPLIPFTVRSANLHRNIIFKDHNVPDVPASYLDMPYPEDLWQNLTDECINGVAGCDVFTIPHNSNLSGGRMFEQTDKTGANKDAAYAATQAQFEPLFEIMQHKGQSECGYESIGNDEACSFELIPWDNIGGDFVGGPLPPERSFVRDALKEGTKLQGTIGDNPFQYGFIGSTDTHISAPGLVAEDAYPAHRGPELFTGDARQGLSDEPVYNPGGLAVVWAEQNTRHSLFEAMQRRETYATSGPRPIVRFFGGWNYPANVCSQSDTTTIGYSGGVPMGGVLPAATSSAPTFFVTASKDPNSNDLQAIQIIKGWTDGSNQTQEEVVVIAGNLNNGASVNENTCVTSGAGATELCGFWQDPNFDASQNAVYYARVLENPSCRWTTYQCNAAGVTCPNPPSGFEQCCDGSLPKTIKERAWTSPIWYED